jgi:ppGpp synthetase/RelA/SpoT-type nucleotidyltranferase
MIIPNAIKRKYNNYRPYIKSLGKKVDGTLREFTTKEHYAYSSRIKTVESLAEKIETGRYKKWEDLDDLFAATVIIPNLNEEAKVIEYLETTFDRVDLKKRGGTNKQYDIFRFDSTRFIGRLKVYGEDALKLTSKISFEVQIRTAFEHAWVVSTYPFAYKSARIDWRFLRLSAQIKASVEQLDMIISGAQEVQKHITPNKHLELEFKVKIQDLIDDPSLSNIIPDEVKPKDISRFVDNIFILLKDSLDKEAEIKIKNAYRKINEILAGIKNEIELYNSDNFPRSISLYQFFLGTLIKHSLITLPNKGFTPFVTDELRDIFPEVQVVKNWFKID